MKCETSNGKGLYRANRETDNCESDRGAGLVTRKSDGGADREIDIGEACWDIGTNRGSYLANCETDEGEACSNIGTNRGSYLAI